MNDPDDRRVIVDADACPRACLAVLTRLKARFGYRLITVASFHHQIQSDDHIVVGDAPDEADLKVAGLVRQGDIVVTQDFGLAALVLAKGGKALSPKGMIYDPQTIDFLLDERSLKAKLQRAGKRSKGPKARTQEDDRRFESSLIGLLTDSSTQVP